MAREFETILKQHAHGRSYRAKVDGRMVGMTSGTGIPQFTIVHNDREFHERRHILCDVSHGHRDLEQPDPVTETFLNQAVYPEKMVENIAGLWKSQRNHLINVMCSHFKSDVLFFACAMQFRRLTLGVF